MKEQRTKKTMNMYNREKTTGDVDPPCYGNGLDLRSWPRPVSEAGGRNDQHFMHESKRIMMS